MIPAAAAIRLKAFAVLACAVLVACGSAPPPLPPAAAASVRPSQVIPIAQTARGVLILMPVEKVAFDFGKATVTAVEAHEFLDRVAALLKDRTKAQVALEGHTDNLGSRTLNQQLSEDRATTIRQELVRRGVAESRLSTQGYAFDRPLVANDSEAGRRENRRVELIILGEQVANITRGEPPNSFEEAFARLKAAIDSGALRPAKGG